LRSPRLIMRSAVIGVSFSVVLITPAPTESRSDGWYTYRSGISRTGQQAQASDLTNPLKVPTLRK
jgi:hypothetical protein